MNADNPGGRVLLALWTEACMLRLQAPCACRSDSISVPRALFDGLLTAIGEAHRVSAVLAGAEIQVARAGDEFRATIVGPSGPVAGQGASAFAAIVDAGRRLDMEIERLIR